LAEQIRQIAVSNDLIHPGFDPTGQGKFAMAVVLVLVLVLVG
jgi:hypothetical protein